MLTLKHWTQTAGLRAECEFHWMQGRELAAGEQPLCRTTHRCGHEPEVRARRLEGGEAAGVRTSESSLTLGVAEQSCPPLSYFRTESLRCL